MSGEEEKQKFLSLQVHDDIKITSIQRKNSSDPRMYVTALIDNNRLSVLIDTGGTHTCIPSSSWDLFQDCGFILCPINGSATVADGGKVEVTYIHLRSSKCMDCRCLINEKLTISSPYWYEHLRSTSSYIRF